MICPYCHEPMKLEETETEKIHTVLEEFPFEDYEEIEHSIWHCLICDYTEDSYDA